MAVAQFRGGADTAQIETPPGLSDGVLNDHSQMAEAIRRLVELALAAKAKTAALIGGRRLDFILSYAFRALRLPSGS
jgi:hypothetical protein